LQSLQIGEVVEDKLRVPGIESLFEVQRPQKEQDKRNERVKLPLVLKASTSTREEIAKAILQTLQYRDDITALSWSVGDEYLELVREPGASTAYASGISEEDVQTVLLNILKSRGILRKFSWELGSKFVRIAYENSQFA